MPIWAQAGLWGLLGSSALILGAALAYLINLPKRVIAGIMAFGCGVLISAVAYDLIIDGFDRSGLWPIVGGALAGSAAYTTANWLVSKRGGKHRKRSGEQLKNGGSGLAIAVGSLLDGIPESIVLGASLVSGGGVSMAMLAAIFLSNLPEGLSSAVGMKNAGHSKAYVLGMWGSIAAVSAVAALKGRRCLETRPRG